MLAKVVVVTILGALGGLLVGFASFFLCVQLSGWGDSFGTGLAGFAGVVFGGTGGLLATVGLLLRSSVFRRAGDISSRVRGPALALVSLGAAIALAPAAILLLHGWGLI